MELLRWLQWGRLPRPSRDHALRLPRLRLGSSPEEWRQWARCSSFKATVEVTLAQKEEVGAGRGHSVSGGMSLRILHWFLGSLKNVFSLPSPLLLLPLLLQPLSYPLQHLGACPCFRNMCLLCRLLVMLLLPMSYAAFTGTSLVLTTTIGSLRNDILDLLENHAVCSVTWNNFPKAISLLILRVS